MRRLDALALEYVGPDSRVALASPRGFAGALLFMLTSDATLTRPEREAIAAGIFELTDRVRAVAQELAAAYTWAHNSPTASGVSGFHIIEAPKRGDRGGARS